MEEENDYFRLINGQTLDEYARLPTYEEILNENWQQTKSNYPLRDVGTSQQSGALLLSEEERESHMHIIGTTGEGKSRFLELLIREDIDRGLGLCFFDPSDRGDTMYKILAYCAEKNHQKVLVIDPHHFYTRKITCPINPFGKYVDASVAKTMDTLRILYGQSEWSSTPIIRRYLKAVLTLLWNAGRTIPDSLYFTEPLYADQRREILEHTSQDNRHRAMVEYAFKHQPTFMQFQSTVRRLEEIFNPVVSAMLGSKEGLDFPKLVAEGWVILVNLYEWYGIEQMHTRLIATTIINELIESVDRLRGNGWKGVYYLYIDEAGQYATESISRLLAYKRKSGLRLVLAHQYNDQFENLKILKAIQNLCKLKVAFYTPDPDDRMKVVKNMYGGELADRDVSYSLSTLRKQHAVFKKPKKAAVIIRIPDVPDVEISEEEVDEYLDFIYSNPIYKHGQNTRHSKPPEKRAVADSKATVNPDLGAEGTAPSIFDIARAAFGVQRNLQIVGEDG